MAQTPRVMAMVARQQSTAEKVAPQWSAEARLPQTIRIPVQIANAVYGVGSGRREIVIRRDGDPIPALIIQWMQGTPQYRTWFLQEPKTQPAESLEAVSVTTGNESAVAKSEEQTFDTVTEMVEDLDADDKPTKRQRRKKAADEE